MKTEIIMYILIYFIPFIVWFHRYKISMKSLYTKWIIKDKLSNIKILIDMTMVYSISVLLFHISYYILKSLKIPWDIDAFLEIAIFSIPVIFYYFFIRKLINKHKIINDNIITKKLSETITIYSFLSLIITWISVISYYMFLQPIFSSLNYNFDSRSPNERMEQLENISYDNNKLKNEKKHTEINNQIQDFKNTALAEKEKIIKDKNDISYNLLKWENEKERQISLLNKYWYKWFKNIEYWNSATNNTWIDKSFVMCIWLKETKLWKYMYRKNNVGNLWWKEYKDEIEGIKAIITVLNNEYLKDYNEIQLLSRYWNKTWAIYSDDKDLWHKTIIKCMTFLKWFEIWDDYNFRINK